MKILVFLRPNVIEVISERVDRRTVIVDLGKIGDSLCVGVGGMVGFAHGEEDLTH